MKRLLAVLLFGLVACTAGGRQANSVTYKPPPPLILVAIVDPTSGTLPDQLHQLGGVVRAGASPGEALVVMLMQAHVAGTYVVRRGDSLSSIAGANGLTLAEIEAANPQFGPLSGRNFGLIYQGEKVTLPDRGAQDPLALVSRAPAGPPLPVLLQAPHEPSNPTDFQQAEYNRTVAANKATNDARIAAWRAEAERAVQPWQSQVTATLDAKAGTMATGTATTSGHALSASIILGVTTLQGLQGRRTLLILGGADGGPGAFAPHSLAGIDLVIANVADPAAGNAWTAAGKSAGAASVSVLDVALTQLQLAQVVNQ